jgi:hypothetical protein
VINIEEKIPVRNVLSDPVLFRLLAFLVVPTDLSKSKELHSISKHDELYGKFLATCPTPKLQNHPLSAVRDCLFNIFTPTVHIWRPSPSSTIQELAIIL